MVDSSYATAKGCSVFVRDKYDMRIGPEQISNKDLKIAADIAKILVEVFEVEYCPAGEYWWRWRIMSRQLIWQRKEKMKRIEENEHMVTEAFYHVSVRNTDAIYWSHMKECPVKRKFKMTVVLRRMINTRSHQIITWNAIMGSRQFRTGEWYSEVNT